ncbi:hypothetical protein PHK61_17750 [Actinomycetospora lutea]|uniref:esterase/lipase family protein n=1 Tax=Actinomycetospora lutea TaxID=663604 RepID=UPI002366E67D|nr:hypothetical protein [Actinomycetospora lutea]MDD7940272.1 hypothetical protein [Actinomycetospora lutea]
MTVPLSGGDEAVTVGERVVLRVPGLTGEVELRPVARNAAAAPDGDDVGHLGRALANAGLERAAAFFVRPTSAPAGDGAVVATPSGSGRQAVLLSRDAAGILHWHLPESGPVTGTGTTGAPDLSIRIPRDRFEAADSATLWTLLEFPLGAVGRAAAHAFEQWERTARPSVATWFPPKHGLRQGVTLTDANWRALAAATGPTLLFLHGIFSTSASAFGGLLDTDLPGNEELWARLDRKYQGRIITFEHPTASVPPEENAEALLELIPRDVHLELDIVCHSRGGLVARVLDGQLAATTGRSLFDVLVDPLREFLGLHRARGRVTVRKIVFAGTPNGGTAIVERENWNTLADGFTTLLDALPPGPWHATTPVFEAVLELVKALAARTADDLPGLRAMDPDSALYAALDRYSGTAPLYYAIEADHEDGVDELIDPIFGRPNDVAVPTTGVGDPVTVRPAASRPSAITGFPVPAARRLVFDPGDVWHLTYFRQEQTRTHLLRWLT